MKRGIKYEDKLLAQQILIVTDELKKLIGSEKDSKKKNKLKSILKEVCVLWPI